MPMANFSDKNSERNVNCESWTVLRDFQCGADKFREGETLKLLAQSQESGEMTFLGDEGRTKKWCLRKGQPDYSAQILLRAGGLSL